MFMIYFIYLYVIHNIIIMYACFNNVENMSIKNLMYF